MDGIDKDKYVIVGSIARSQESFAEPGRTTERASREPARPKHGTYRVFATQRA